MTEEQLEAELERLKTILRRPGATIHDKKRFIDLIQRILQNRGDKHCIELRGLAAGHPALYLCAAEYNTTYFEEMNANTPRPEAQRLGQTAWLSALPPLNSAQSISDFITCVSFGIARDIITSDKGMRLLYAAQIAQANYRIVERQNAEKADRRRGPYRKTQESDPGQSGEAKPTDSSNPEMGSDSGTDPATDQAPVANPHVTLKKGPNVIRENSASIMQSIGYKK